MHDPCNEIRRRAARSILFLNRGLGFGFTLSLAMGVPPLALFALSTLGPFIIDDLELTRWQFGSCATVAFGVAAVFSGPLGRSVDLFSGRTLMFLLFGGAGLSLVMEALSPSYTWLLVGVVACGIAQSLSNPVTNQLISVHIGTGRQGTFMGVKQSGVQMHQFIVGMTLPGLAFLLDWRMAVVSTAGVALVGLFLAHRFVSRTAHRGPRARTATRLSELPTQVWRFAGYAILSGAGVQATNVYLPLFGHEQLKLSVGIAGLTVAVLGGVGLVARIVWGRVSERIAAPERILPVMAMVAAVATSALLGVSFIGWPWLMWAGVALNGASAVAFNVIFMLALIRNVDSRVIGTASGTVSTGLYLGFAAGPIAFGSIIDSSDSYALGWACVAVIYMFMAVLSCRPFKRKQL